MFDDELESFKKIDLRSYAASQGYELDKRDSWRGSAVMRNSLGDKVVIKRASDDHYIYFSVRDHRDNGTIIDFVQNRDRVSIGAVRKVLRPWIGQPPVAVPVFSPLEKTGKDRMRVEAEFTKMHDAPRHPYLENERALPASLLASERFAARIRSDARGNAVFPHFDADGLCGFEIKNSGFTGFATGGSKGLWLSHETADDSRLVFCESSIDALSHAVLFPDMPHGSEVIAAMDADADGAKLADVVRKAVELSGRLDLRFVLQEPFGFKDWNDQLRKKGPELSFPTAHPSLKAG